MIRRSLLLVLVLVSSVSADSSVDRLLAWNEANLRAVELTSPSPCLVARNFAIIQGAIFETYNAIHPAFRSEFAGIPEAPAGLDPELACLAAAWHASRTLFPSYRAIYDELWAGQLESWPDAARRAASVKYGLAVADTCLQDRAGDGASATVTYIPKDAIGKWRRTAPRFRPPELPQWPKVRPFVIERADQFRPGPPPALESPEYAAAVDEVRELGRKRAAPLAAHDDATQTIAHFWSCFSYTATPSGHWNEIAGILARREHLDFPTTARIFAVLNLTLADVGIATWDCKYHYEFWRPIQAIRQADEDPNPATEPERDWISELEAPPHPEYVSGHSAFSGAGARMLALLLHRDAIEFTVSSPSAPGVALTYDSLEACSEEIGMSRLYGGIHFRFSNRTGLDLGRRIAEWAYQHAYQPLDG